MSEDDELRVAVLVNQYPMISHSFVRREIEGLERAGVHVERISIRPPSEPLLDADARAESARTRTLLGSGARPCVTAFLGLVCRHPIRALSGLILAARMGWRSERGLLRHVAYLLESALLLRWLKESRVEHLHAHFVTNPAAVARLTRALGGPPYSFTAHGTNSFRSPERNALLEKVRAARFVVTVSEDGRRRLRELTPEAEWPKFHVVRCGVDSTLLEHPEVPSPAMPRLVCVARLEPLKGHLHLLEAASRLRSEGLDLELTFVGDGSQRDAIQDAVRRLGLDGHVHLRGWQGGNAVRDEVLAARALVLPSLDEGLPVVLMEALALGRPVVGTEVGGVAELVVPGENGWLVPPASADALASALHDLLRRSAQELEEMGRRGARSVARLHNATSEARRLAQLFEPSGCPQDLPSGI